MRNTLMRTTNNSLLDDFFKDEFFLPRFSSAPKLDVYQEDDKYVVEVDLPGYKKEDIHISYQNDLLTVSAERREETEENKKNYIYRSRSQSGFKRQIRFSNISHSNIDAKFEEGVLKIILPIQVEEKETKRIEIQ